MGVIEGDFQVSSCSLRLSLGDLKLSGEGIRSHLVDIGRHLLRELVICENSSPVSRRSRWGMEHHWEGSFTPGIICASTRLFVHPLLRDTHRMITERR